MARLDLTRPRDCDHARSLVSLRLDDELSELEHVLLEAHLSGCAACNVYAADTAIVARKLREAPLERPERAVSLPAARRRGYLRGLQTAAAGAVAAAAVAVVAVGITPAVTGGNQGRTRTEASFYEPVSVRSELQILRQARRSEGVAGPVIPA